MRQALQNTRLTTPLSLILILLLTVFVYYPGLSGDFTFDDFPNLLQNNKVHLDTLSYDTLVASSLSSDSGLLKRPISMASFALNSYFFGKHPYSWKIINLIVHLLTGLGIYVLGRLILEKYNMYRKQEFGKRALYLLPFFIASIWLVHPLNLTSVLYIIQRMTSLSALFTIWAACGYIWTRSRYYQHNKQFWLIPFTVIMLSSLSVLSKENGILIPLFLFLIESVLFRFRNADARIDKSIIVLFAILLIIPAIMTIGVLIARPGFLQVGYSIRDFTLTERLLTEARALAFYLQMILMPSINELGLYHDDFIISRSLVDPPATLLAMIFMCSLIVVAIVTIRKYPLFAFGILWFFAAHLLESTILPLEIVHEHRNYVANFGIIFSLVYLLARLPLLTLHPSVKYALYLFPVILLSYVTNLRAYQWSDNILHAVYEARHHPNSARAVYSEGRIYANLTIAGDLDKKADAYTKLEHSSTLYRHNILPDIALILLSTKLGEPVNDRWIDIIKHKLENYPLIPTTIGSLMELIKCQNKDCKLDNRDIEGMLTIALNKGEKRHPDIVTIYAFHVAYNMRDLRKGEQLFHEATLIAPDKTQYRINLVRLLLLMEQYDKVRQQLDYLKRFNPLGKNNSLIRDIELTLKERSDKIKDD
jgi:hypothetical protein